MRNAEYLFTLEEKHNNLVLLLQTIGCAATIQYRHVYGLYTVYVPSMTVDKEEELADFPGLVLVHTAN